MNQTKLKKNFKFPKQNKNFKEKAKKEKTKWTSNKLKKVNKTGRRCTWR